MRCREGSSDVSERIFLASRVWLKISGSAAILFHTGFRFPLFTRSPIHSIG